MNFSAQDGSGKTISKVKIQETLSHISDTAAEE